MRYIESCVLCSTFFSVNEPLTPVRQPVRRLKGTLHIFRGVHVLSDGFCSPCSSSSPIYSSGSCLGVATSGGGSGGGSSRTPDVPVFCSPAARRSVPAATRVLMCLEAGQPGRGASWDVCSRLSFWKRVTGIVFSLAVIFILIGVILYSPRLLDLEPCPDDWLYYKRKCYYQSGSVADWNSSRKFCSDFGASLAVIDHVQDLEFILYRMRTIDFWIGLQKTENKFFWVNGESLNTNLFHVNITDDGDCVHINSAFVSTKKCSSQKNWLCTLAPQPVQVLLNGSTAFWRVSKSSKLCIIGVLGEGGHYSLIKVVNEDVEQDWTQHRPLENTVCRRSPARLCTADHHPLSSASQPVLNPPYRPLIYRTLSQLCQQDVMGDSIKS